jgi:hypothetical protein
MLVVGLPDYAQKYKKIVEVYRATVSVDVQFEFVRIASDDHADIIL